LEMGSHKLLQHGPPTVILLMSASQVAGITGLPSYRCLAPHLPGSSAPSRQPGPERGQWESLALSSFQHTPPLSPRVPVPVPEAARTDTQVCASPSVCLSSIQVAQRGHIGPLAGHMVPWSHLFRPGCLL
jgi:hypothetical protein